MGVAHSCAVLSDGTVRCWGANGGGTLGDGTTTDRLNPVAVLGISTATQVARGESQSCAVLSDGTVRCWGWNDYGQLGDGTKTDSSTPVVVSGISTATRVGLGMSHSCALLSDGTVQCWGSNAFGQLGDGTKTDSLTPVAVFIPCDASVPPTNGGVGNCTNTLASGATCEPTCDAGYTVSGASSCTAGTLTAATCDVNPPPPSAASRLTRAVTVAALLAGALAM